MRGTSTRVARGARSEGFTLVEAAMATAIVGIGVAALMMSLGAGTTVNDNGQKLTRAAVLAQEIREWTLRMDYDSLDALRNVTYSPPCDGQGNTIADMPGWSQKLTGTWRTLTDVKTESLTKTDIAQVQVDVSYKSKPILTTSWLVARR